MLFSEWKLNNVWEFIRSSTFGGVAACEGVIQKEENWQENNTAFKRVFWRTGIIND